MREADSDTHGSEIESFDDADSTISSDDSSDIVASETIDTKVSEEMTETDSMSETSESEPDSSEMVLLPNEESGFVVHYIDVGQGDAALIVCDGEAMLIDGGPVDASELIYSYLDKYEIYELKYIVGTHPDEDHIGGLAAAMNVATVERAFCSVDEYDSKPFSSFIKYLNQQKVSLEIPEAGMELMLGSAKVLFLAPIKALDETNNNSIIIRVEYGDTSFLFTGDAEFEEEDTLIYSDFEFASTVLKVAHHGSEYSTSEVFLDIVSPSIAIISCGNENTYGFPKQAVLDLLEAAGVVLYRTDLHGDILVYSDGEQIEVETEYESENDPFQAPSLENPDPSGEHDCDYVVNKNSGKFHLPECDSVKQMKEKNKWYYVGDREDLIEMGYTPCKNCNP